jgi:hypothetical protein
VKFSKDYVLFCHITTQIAGEKYGNLLEEKGGEGWPFLVFMDPEGNVVAVHEENRTPEEFGKTGEKARAYLRLKEKAEKGDKTAQIDLLITQLSLGQLKADEIGKKIQAVGTPTPEQKARLDGEVLNAQILDLLKTVDSDEKAKEVGKKFYETQKSGKPGPTGGPAFLSYYSMILDLSEQQKDPQTFEAALKALKGKYGTNPQAANFFTRCEQKLQELKEAKK